MKKRLSSILIVLSLLLTLLPTQVFAEEAAVESDCAAGEALVEAEVPAPEEDAPAEGETAVKEDASAEEAPLGSTAAAEAALSAEEASEETFVEGNLISADLSGYLYKYGGFPDLEENAGLRRRYLSVADYAGAEAAIVDAYKNWENAVDVSRYNIPQAKGLQFVVDVLNRHPELFYVGSYFGCSADGSYILSYELPYDEGYTQEMVSIYEDAVTCALSRVNSTMTPLQKALVLHDYLAQHAEYDLTYSKYNSYNAIVDGTAVCQGYTMAYMDLMNRVGIPCATSSSDAMNHIWNLVQIDGDWYHVDVTWDDPVDDTLGRVLHTNFLRSDEGIADPENSGHYGWEDDYDCVSDKYDSGWFWSACNSAIGMVDNTAAYYLSREKAGGFGKYNIQLIERDWTTGVEVVTRSVVGKWIDLNGYSWGVNSYMSCDSGAMWFNTNDAVYRYDPMTKELSKVDISSVYSGGDNIYQAVVQDGMLKFAVGDAPGFTENIYRLKVSGPVVPPAEKENGLVEENGTWYYCVNGVVDTGYTGLAYREDIGWWYVENGRINFDYTGLAYREDIGWWYVENSGITFDYTGLTYTPEYGWWYVTNSQLRWDYTGLAYREDIGWWYVENSGITFSYTGLTYTPEYGWWYVENSNITFCYNGVVAFDGKTYTIVNSQVIG